MIYDVVTLPLMEKIVCSVLQRQNKEKIFANLSQV